MPDLGYLASPGTEADIRDLQQRIENLEASFLVVTYVEPSKPRETMIRFADGVEWNPGAGRGLYQYVSGTWTKL